MIAAATNAVDAVELLFAAGANIEAKMPGGQTGLTMAAQGGAADGVRKLLELGADLNGSPDTEPVYPSTPLALATARSASNSRRAAAAKSSGPSLPAAVRLPTLHVPFPVWFGLATISRSYLSGRGHGPDILRGVVRVRAFIGVIYCGPPGFPPGGSGDGDSASR